MTAAECFHYVEMTSPNFYSEVHWLGVLYLSMSDFYNDTMLDDFKFNFLSTVSLVPVVYFRRRLVIVLVCYNR